MCVGAAALPVLNMNDCLKIKFEGFLFLTKEVTQVKCGGFVDYWTLCELIMHWLETT